MADIAEEAISPDPQFCEPFWRISHWASISISLHPGSMSWNERRISAVMPTLSSPSYHVSSSDGNHMPLAASDLANSRIEPRMVLARVG